MLNFLRKPAFVTDRFNFEGIDSFVHMNPENLVLELLISNIFVGRGYHEYQKAISKK
jgi:hypothetical protein